VADGSAWGAEAMKIQNRAYEGKEAYSLRLIANALRALLSLLCRDYRAAMGHPSVTTVLLLTLEESQIVALPSVMVLYNTLAWNVPIS